MIAKTVLITGCSKGIGKATAIRFADAGWRVYAGVRDLRSAQFSHPNIVVVQIDVGSPGSIHRCFHLLKGKIDVVVNNAGFGLWGPLESYTEQELEEQVKVNILGAARVTRASLAYLAPKATIVNVASVVGHIGMPYYSMYAATKFAIVGMSESLSLEFAPKGIRVKLVEPGAVKTEFFHASQPNDSFGKRLHAYYTKAFAEGDDPLAIAELILRAATDEKDTFAYRPKRARRILALAKYLPSELVRRQLRKRFM